MSLFRRLQARQSSWQFAATECPPFDHGVTWSASISSIANGFLHLLQTPFCRS